jgi:hypothetical protein
MMVVVAPFGPPFDRILTCVKSLSAPIVVMMRRKMLTFLRPGQVTERKRCHGEAPSTFAAS